MSVERHEFSDQAHLLRSPINDDLESRSVNFKDYVIIKHLDRRSNSFNRNRNVSDRQPTPNARDRHEDFFGGDGDGSSNNNSSDVLGECLPPEWALLIVSCLLGLATGLCVVIFEKGVHTIHEWAWAGTPPEGAAWLRIQRLAGTWHRILLVPVTGGVIVGMMHGLVEILDQIRDVSSSKRQGLDIAAGVFPTVKAIQAAVTLGNKSKKTNSKLESHVNSPLGSEGPNVDIGKSCANGLSVMMETNKQRKIAFVAAGAASGISSGFNAAVAGCFFAIETVLRPLQAENSPPFTTAVIILASVVSSTVSRVLLGTQSAFTVPNYDLKSAAELPMYLILGILCGVVSVAFTRLVAWFTQLFEFIRQRYSLPVVVCPALGGLGAGIIGLKYPGVLYWGFTNVEEILRTGKTATAPVIWLLTQLVAAKAVATAICKGSGLVGGLYAPSLMIGAAVGAIFGGTASKLINSAIPEDAAVAQPQAYALVGMAATLASVCSVPLTSVLLLFELTKDYRIVLPLKGAVGPAIRVPSITNQPMDGETSYSHCLARSYSSISNYDVELSFIENISDHEIVEGLVLEHLKVSRVMSKDFVKVSKNWPLKEAIQIMNNSKENCVLVVDEEGLLEGILTRGDFRRFCTKYDATDEDGASTIVDANTCRVSSVCSWGISYRGQVRGLLTCFPNTDLAIAKELMEAKGIKQLPVVNRYRGSDKESKRRIVAILHCASIWNCLRDEIHRRRSV